MNSNIKDIGLLEEADKLIALGYIDKIDAYKFSLNAVTELTNTENTQIISAFVNEGNRTFKPFNDDNLDLNIVSTSISDTFDISIDYIDNNRERVITDITLTGTTPITLTNVYCVNELRNNSSTNQAGNIFVTDINGLFYQSMILVGGESSNISLSSAFSMPKGYAGIITRIFIAPQQSVDFKGGMFVRRKNEVFQYVKNLTAYQTPVSLRQLEVFIDEESDIVFEGNSKLGGLVYASYDIEIFKKSTLGKYL